MASILYVLFISRVKRKVCIKNAEDKSIWIFLYSSQEQKTEQRPDILSCGWNITYRYRNVLTELLQYLFCLLESDESHRRMSIT